MAWLFIKLKLTIYRNLLRSSPAALIGFIISALVGIQLMLTGFLGLAGLRDLTGLPVTRWEIATCAFTVLTLVWTIGPLALTGYDDSLRMDVLLLFPLRTRDIFLGHLGGSLCGIATLSSSIALSGAIIGLTGGLSSIIFAPLVIIFYIAFNIVLARSVGTALTGLLRSRRGREIAMGAIIVTATLGYFAVLTASQISPKAIRSAADIFLWAPPGWAVSALRSAADGDYWLAVGWLAGLGSMTAILVCGWLFLLKRILTAADSSTISINSANAKTPIAATRLDYFLAGHQSCAIAVWCWRYSWRSPNRRIALITAFLGGILVPIILLNSVPTAGPGWVYLSFLTGWLMGTAAANQLGYDGAARWQLLASALNPRVDLVGRNIMLLALAIPGILASSGIMCFLTHGWSYFPGSLALGLASFTLALAAGNLTTAYCPYPIPDNPQNPLASGRPGNIGLLLGLSALTFGGQLLFGLPLILLAGYSLIQPLAQWGLVLLAGLLSYPLWRGSISLAEKRLGNRGPELLSQVTSSR